MSINSKEKGYGNSEIARLQNVSERRVRQIYSYYRKTGRIPKLMRAGRRKNDKQTEFESYLLKNKIRFIVGRVRHPQSNGKIFEKKIRYFSSLDEFFHWYNCIRPHGAFDISKSFMQGCLRGRY